MTLWDKVIAFRKYKGMTRRQTCDLMDISLKELREIERRVFGRRNGTRSGFVNDGHLRDDENEEGLEVDDSASLELA